MVYLPSVVSNEKWNRGESRCSSASYESRAADTLDRALEAWFNPDRKSWTRPQAGERAPMSKIADVDDILRRFPGPVILFPSRGRWVRLIAIGICLTIVSALSIGYGRPLTGILGSIFFAALTIVGIAMLLPGSSSLRLGRDSFTWTRLYRAKTYEWNKVSDFGVWTWRRGSVVVFEIAKPHLTALENINKAVSGRNGFLPDTFGLAPDRLVRLMIAWRNLAIREIR